VRATRKIAGAFPVPARMREYQRNATGRDVQRKGERREADAYAAYHAARHQNDLVACVPPPPLPAPAPCTLLSILPACLRMKPLLYS
jgi:hypothetical protein